jgi:5-methylcytosine-specific restriction endonuclease McrA
MLKLNRPQFSAMATFAACISRVRDRTLKAKLNAVTHAIRVASDEYVAAAQAQKLDQIARNSLVDGTVTIEEMEAVYKGRMANEKAPGRAIYDDIFAAAKGRCPLCAHREVKTLDHHLPKAYYPALAVAPVNLVPACRDCNYSKKAKFPLVLEDVSIHPYFDNVADERWLFADVVEVTPAAICFRVVPPTSWDTLLSERLKRHFHSFELSALYGSQAAEELVSIRQQLIALQASGGAGPVRAYLKERTQSCIAGRLNGWRGAAYEAWSDSDWFCNGGFVAIG